MISKALNIRPDERERVFLLLVHSFFIGVFVACYFTYANGAFLSLFELNVLPYAYIASGLCGYLSALVFSRLQARLPYDRLLVGLLLFIFSLTLVFRLLAFSPEVYNWLTFVMFIWSGPFLSLIGLQYWGMALKLFDLRQGKRLFSIIGSGDVVSSIIGYMSMPVLLSNMASIQLLWIGALSLLVGLMFQLVIIRNFSAQLTAVAPARKEKDNAGAEGPDQSIFKSRYFKLIALLAVISLLGQYLVDYNFMGVFKGTFSQEQLTQFIGLFFGLIKITELLTKTLVAGRLLNNYGIRLGLSLLPILLLIFTGIALAVHPFMKEGFMFFLLISINKLFDKVVRRGMEEPSFKALYQPFEGPTKIVFQTRVEGAVKQLGVIVAGILLILLGLIPGFDVLQAHAAYILIAILVVWLILSRKTYEEYRSLLTKRLATIGEQDDSTRAGPVFSIDLFKERLLGDEPNSLAALHIMENMAPGTTWSFLPALKQHPHQDLKAYAAGLEERARNLVSSTLNSSVTSSEVRLLAKSSNPEDRKKATMLICQFQMSDNLDLLGSLLKDREVPIFEILLTSEGILGNSDSRDWLITAVIEKFRTDYDVVKRLIQSEQVIIPLLREAFHRLDSESSLQWLNLLFKAYSSQPHLILTLIRGLSITGEPEARKFLETKLTDHSIEVRSWALRGLCDAGFRARTTDAFFQYKQFVISETATATWLLAAIHDLEGKDVYEALILALKEEYEATKENLFCLLAVMYDRRAVDQIRENLTSGLNEKEALAVEMADVLLDEDLKDIVFPIIDALPVHDKLKKLQLHFLQEKLNVSGRLKNIIYHDYTRVNSFIKALAIEALAQMDGRLPHEVIAQNYGKNLMLKEVAFLALGRKHPETFQIHIDRESEKDCEHFDTLTGQRATIQQKLKWLQELPVFQGLSHHILLNLAYRSKQCSVDEHGSFNLDNSEENYLLIVVKGQLMMCDAIGTSTCFKSGEILAIVNDVFFNSCTLQSSSESNILCIEKREFFSFVRVYGELANALLEDGEGLNRFFHWIQPEGS